MNEANNDEVIDPKCPEYKLCWRNANTIRYLINFYIDVGTLPIEKAKMHVARTFESYKPIWEALPKGYGVIIIPRRQQETTIEYMDLLHGKEPPLFGLDN